MSTAMVEGNIGLQTHRPHTDAAIVFGSTSAGRAGKPASVRATCEAIGLARSTYYYQSHRSAAAIALEQKIVLRLHELRESHPNDGYRRMTQQLQLEGFHVNRKRISRLMQLHSLSAKPSKPGNGFARYQQPLSTVSRLREAPRPTGPRQAWVADIAYVHIRSGLVYAAAIIDVWSREVIGYAASLHITNRLASIALHSAVRAHRPAPGCIHHSNCGTQYLMRGYRELLGQYGLVSSVGDASEQPALAPPQCSTVPTSRQVVEMPAYEGWESVINHTREFVEALYSRERIDWILATAVGRGVITLPAAPPL